MQNNDYLINYYNEYDEEVRLANNRVKLVATDGASRYIREYLEEMDEETFGKWLSYHFVTCERQDLIGATNHSLDILRKV